MSIMQGHPYMLLSNVLAPFLYSGVLLQLPYAHALKLLWLYQSVMF